MGLIDVMSIKSLHITRGEEGQHHLFVFLLDEINVVHSFEELGPQRVLTCLPTSLRLHTLHKYF